MTEDRGQKSEDRSQRTEDGRQIMGFRCQVSGVREWKPGDRGRKFEVGMRPPARREGGKRAKSIAQSVQKVENKRITTEQHGKNHFVNNLFQCNSVKIRGEKKY